MPSPSLTKLNERLTEVDCLLEVCRSRIARGTRNVSAEQPALLRSALVLLSSHVEGFFEDLTVDIVLAFDDHATCPSDFPDEIRARQVLGDAARWISADQIRRWRLVKDVVAASLFSDYAAHTPGSIDAELHISGFGNPGTKEVRDLFKGVGIPDCWSDFHQLEPQIGYKNEIDAIVSRRNQIAHGDLNAIVTMLDVQSYVRNFRHTATVFVCLAENYVSSRVVGFKWQ